MNYWLVKSEPEAYSWQRLLNEEVAVWDGVRNYQARNNLMAMKKGDLVLFYHSVSEKTVTGIAIVENEYFPDPTTNDTRWVAVVIRKFKSLSKPVSLATIKLDKRLSEIALVRHTRLSVMPLKSEEYDIIVSLGEN